MFIVEACRGYLVAPESRSKDLDPRPYLATAVGLAAALVLNLWTRNGLWFAYTLVGCFGFGVFALLARTGRLVFPPLAVWMFGVGGAMHYVGGSLSGLHTIGGPNGLYYAFPWWDNLVHALGTGAMAVAASSLLQPRLGRSTVLIWFLATCVAVTVGVMVELYEFAQFVWFGTVDQGFYTNTLLDLYNNVLGAAVGAFVYLRLAPVPQPVAGAPTGQ